MLEISSMLFDNKIIYTWLRVVLRTFKLMKGSIKILISAWYINQVNIRPHFDTFFLVDERLHTELLLAPAAVACRFCSLWESPKTKLPTCYTFLPQGLGLVKWPYGSISISTSTLLTHEHRAEKINCSDGTSNHLSRAPATLGTLILEGFCMMIFYVTHEHSSDKKNV